MEKALIDAWSNKRTRSCRNCHKIKYLKVLCVGVVDDKEMNKIVTN